MNPDSTHNPDRLPPRDLPRRRSGRHRNPLSFDSWVGTPELVLAVPASGSAAEEPAAEIGRQTVDLLRSYRPEVTIRFGLTRTGDPALGLDAALEGLGPKEGRPVSGIVVPLVAGPHTDTTRAVEDAIDRTGADVRVTGGLGPHPMLAEVLHLRLAESGFVRADRMRLISVVASDAAMCDGVLVGAAGGEESVSAAGITAVLLAARLGITVLPADLEDDAAVAAVMGHLGDAGCGRPVIAPSVLGPELPEGRVDALAERHGARTSAALGSGGTIAKIAALRYAEVLNTLGVETPPSSDELPAPVGSRHRPER